MPDRDSIPSFVLLVQGYGSIFIDVVSEKIVPSDGGQEFWLSENGRSLYSRDLVLFEYQSEYENRLKKDSRLFDRKSRTLCVPTARIIYFARNSQREIEKLFGDEDLLAETVIGSEKGEEGVLDEVCSYIAGAAPLTQNVFDIAIALVEGTYSLGVAKKSAPVTMMETYNDFIQKSLENTYKLDEQQRRVALQLPEGPQRIRGLAGTGKTVILCMKAALAHLNFNNFNILFVFNTQSMYNQIERTIEKYYVPEARKTVDWSKLKVFHAWGGRERAGLYSETCKKYGYSPKALRDTPYGSDGLQYIYSDLLKNVGDRLVPEYDMVLIDEAQDFPQELFETIYRLTKDPKRIVWAYDEFQSLKDLRMPKPSALFGVKADGTPNISDQDLEGVYPGEIGKDFILPNSYRNTRVSLMMAHGAALGLYRDEGVVDILDDRASWQSLGYAVLEPEFGVKFKEGDTMEVVRPEANSRNNLERLLRENGKDEKSLVDVALFDDMQGELQHVSNEIKMLIEDEKIDPEEIIVITLDAINYKAELLQLRMLLDSAGIKSITPGAVEKTSAFKEKGRVTLVTPFRAKGNEANMVFVINMQKAYTDASLRARNALFVAITRSRGWVRLSGHGRGAKEMQDEISKILADYPRFKFRFPSESSIARSRVILSTNDKIIEKKQSQLDELIGELPELLIERIKSDPELLKKIIGSKGDEE